MQAEEGTDWLLELLTELQLQQYFLRIRDELNVTRLSHFEYVKNEDLEKIGMGRPGVYIPPTPLPLPLAGCAASFGKPTGANGAGRDPYPNWLVTVTVSLCPAGQRRLWEAVKRRKAMCKRKSWMSKVGMREGQVWQRNSGRQEKLDPSLYPSRVPGSPTSLEADREMGRSPCHPCPTCGVTLPVCAPVPLRLLGHFPAKDSPATLAFGKFIPLMLFASLSGNLQRLQRVNQSLLPDSSVGRSRAQDIAHPAAPQQGGKALYPQAGTYCDGMLIYALIPSHPKLVLLTPYGSWQPRRAEFGRAQFASWALGHSLSPEWDMMRMGF